MSNHMSEILQNLRIEDDLDILSTMPDSILCEIISKLETKEAVKTSLLSSRYKSLWKNITSLKFMSTHFGGDAVRMAHFVNNVLIFLKSKSINEFRLEVETQSHLRDIPAWVSAAIYMNVKVLKLIFWNLEEDEISMPACLYTSKTLEFLELSLWKSRNASILLDVPEFVSLPKLTLLKLHWVKYSSDDSVRRLISGCSSLEKLTICRDVFDDVGTFSINSPTLKTLCYIFITDDIDYDFKFELNAPALRDLQLSDTGSRDFSVVNLSLLESTEIKVASPRGVDPESHYERVMKFLQGVFNVNHLWISGHTLEALSLVPSPEMNSNYSELIMDRKSLQDLLEYSTEDHELYLSKDSSDTTHVVRWSVGCHWRFGSHAFLPVCLLSYLKTISVRGFKGRESELSMIAYILKNAKVLRKITIEVTSDADAEFELCEKIMKFNRASTRCEITFS